MNILFYLHNLWEISATTRLAYDLAIVLRDRFNVNIEFAVNKRIHNDIKNLPFKLYVLNRKGEFGKAQGLRDIIGNNKYDVVFSYMLTQNVILSISKFLSSNKKTVYIGSVHNSDNFMENKEFYKFPYRILMKRIYENLDGIVVVSEAVKEDVNKAFFVKKEKMKVIYNYINIEKIKRLAQSEIPEKDIFRNPVIINVGRVEEQKGQEYLIRAFRIVKQEIPQAKLVIIGDGSLTSRLKNLSKNLNIHKDVHFFGYKENPFKYVAKAKVFAFPSLWEGVGNVVLEAQALGIPVVAFDSQGGHVDVLKNSGILVPLKDVRKLAENLIEILKNTEKWEKYSELSLKNIQNYSVNKKAEEYYNYFLEKIKEKRNA